METVLQPGITLPAMTFLAANLGKYVAIEDGRSTVLVFCPVRVGDDLCAYQARLADFSAINAQVIVVTSSPADELVTFSERIGITLPLVSDASLAKWFGVPRATGSLLSTVFVLDDERLIRRVFEPGMSDCLPNPAMVVRAIRGLANNPKPAPITDDDWCLGPRDAPVGLTEYGDYQCGHCAEMYHLLKKILPEYGDKVVLVHRHYPLRHSHPLAQLAAEAAEAAGAQGWFWEMHDELFAQANNLSEERIIECARRIGADGERIARALESHTFQGVVEDDFRLALTNRIKFPPAIFINRILWEGPRTRDAICARINCLLACCAGQ